MQIKTPRQLKWLLNLYGPYVGAGIKITHVDDNWRRLDVRMKLRWYSRNAKGTHFGGSLYSMVDPHYMLLLMPILGRQYRVWDQAAEIRFVKATRDPVFATFHITDEMLEGIKHNTASGKAYRPEYHVRVHDAKDNTIAEVRKVLYVRLREKAIKQ